MLAGGGKIYLLKLHFAEIGDRRYEIEGVNLELRIRNCPFGLRIGNDGDWIDVRRDRGEVGEEAAQVLAAAGVRFVVEPAVNGETHSVVERQD